MLDVNLKSITKTYNKLKVLDSVNLKIQQGKFTTILGPSGCGKTTILKIISGLEDIDSGEVSIGGKIVSSKDIIIPPEKRDIGMVFQSYALWPHLNVFENIAFPLKIRKNSKDEIQRKVTDTLKLVKLEGYGVRKVNELSGGQQQRVALARALVYNPKILLLDEPLANLDIKIREEMRRELKELQRKTGITTLFVTHDQNEAMVLSDKIIVMDNGKIIQEGTPYEVYNGPVNEFVANFIGNSNLIPGKIIESGDNGLVEAEYEINFYCQIPDQFKKGDTVLICIRPENINLSEKAPLLKNTWQAKIEKKSFLGNVTEYKVRLGNTTLVISEKSYSNFTIGKDTHVSIEEDKINIIQVNKRRL